MSAWREVLTRNRQRLFVLALAVYGLYGLAWPLSAGRDFGTYSFYFVELFRSEPLLPMVMLWRMPLAPLFFGGLLTLGGSVLAEAALGVAYALTVVAISVIGSVWSERAGWLSAAAVLAYSPYAALMHTAGSDSLFAVVFIGWAALVSIRLRQPSWRVMGWHGVAVFALVLIRPVAQLLLLFGLWPFLFNGARSAQVAGVAAFLAVGAGLLAGWAGYNYWRFGDFTVARGGAIVLPLYRTFVLDRSVRAENGPGSQRLAKGVESDLLAREPYRTAGVTVDEYMVSGNREKFFDLVGMSDRVWGWGHDYQTLREAGVEAIWQHPRVYLTGLVRAWGQALLLPYVHEQPSPAISASVPARAEEASSHMWWLLSTPGQQISVVWDRMHPQIAWSSDKLARRWEEEGTQAARLNHVLPGRKAVTNLGRLYNGVARWWPPLIVWLVLGAAGCVSAGWRRMLPVLVPVVFSLMLIGVTLLGLPHVAQYRLPFDPLMLSWGIGGGLELTSRIRRSHN